MILIFSSVLCGVMAQYIGKKALISGAYVLFTLSSLACVFADAPVLLAVMRALMGVAMGFIGTAMVGLIAELYMDENARSSVLGYYNGIMAGMGALFSLGAGYLALKKLAFCVSCISGYDPCHPCCHCLHPSDRARRKEGLPGRLPGDRPL